MAAISVTTTAAVVLAAAQDRTSIVLQNISDTDIYVYPAATVTASEGANTGIRVIAAGNFVISPSNVSADKLQAAWYGIHGGAGNKTLLVNVL